MATFTKYDNFVQALCDKLVDAFGTTDIWKAVIHTDAPVPPTDTAVTDLTQISGTNGYTTGGSDITFNSTRSSGTVTATAVDVVWTASGGNLGSSTSCRYVSIYDSSAAGQWLCNSYDYGSMFTVASGETFTLDFGASYWALT